MLFRFYSTMQVDIPKLEIKGGENMMQREDPDLDNVAHALDKLGDFCGTHLECSNFIREQLAVELNNRMPGKEFNADELPVRYSGFHGLRVVWPADLIAEQAKREDRDKALMNRKGRRQIMKKERKRNKKGKYSYRP